jgi:hypothetical protein
MGVGVKGEGLCDDLFTIVDTGLIMKRSCGLVWAALPGFAAGVLMLIPGTYTQIHGQVYRDAESVYLGWPFVHPNNAYRLVSNALLLDIACMLVVASATGVVISHVLRKLVERRQYTLGSMFSYIAFFATTSALLRYCDYNLIHPADFVDSQVLFDLIALRYGPWIFFPIVFGLACVPTALVLLISRTARIVCTQCFRERTGNQPVTSR